ncbi:hypothetical protein B0I33_105171 [Prauserella shujinwangii]|uniref:Uncharacterized protein n=1 Tax=Prauserella shujinwangii TaxID=1453103 RepID=A0A2T0LUS6_9PSEU|nr:hypothetical protein [Prauserella shujinwangii]PRX47592.1 hypothetical protein B0I33_105171 [Prauserella shujinwangii]
MRLAVTIVAVVALAGLTAACGEERHPASSAPKLWQTGTRTPTVTLTEPAGGPLKDLRGR